MVSVVSLDESFDSLVKVALIKLSNSKFKPDFGFVGLISEFRGKFDVLDVIEEDLNSFDVLTEFLVDAESFFIEFVSIFFSNSSEFLSIVVIKSVDVVHNTAGLRADGSQNKKILEIFVSSEIRVVEDDTLK